MSLAGLAGLEDAGREPKNPFLYMIHGQRIIWQRSKTAMDWKPMPTRPTGLATGQRMEGETLRGLL